MRFGEPDYLQLLWLALALAGFLRWALRRRRRLAERFAHPAVLPRLVSPKAWTGRKSQALWLVAAWVFLVGALAQPRWGFQWEELRQEGVDLVVAVDVSYSMLATDVKPSRLQQARHKVADLIRMLEGDRIGLVAFAGTAFVQCPLTLDYQAAEIFLNALDTDLIPVQGTDLGQAIRVAGRAFSRREMKSKALLLITDGEDHAGNALLAAREAREQGIKIFALGIGGKDGVPIPDPATGGFKKDTDGEVVLTRLNEALLKKLAGETGGAYARSVTGDEDLQTLYLKDIKQRVESRELKSTRAKRWQERFQWLIALALVCLMVERGIREH